MGTGNLDMERPIELICSLISLKWAVERERERRKQLKEQQEEQQQEELPF